MQKTIAFQAFTMFERFLTTRCLVFRTAEDDKLGSMCQDILLYRSVLDLILLEFIIQNHYSNEVRTRFYYWVRLDLQCIVEADQETTTCNTPSYRLTCRLLELAT